MKTTPIEIAQIFKLNLGFRIGMEHRMRWLAVIEELTQYSRSELVEEGKKILEAVGKDKPRLYYLEAVRRNLRLKEHESLKRSSMPQHIKDLFK